MQRLLARLSLGLGVLGTLACVGAMVLAIAGVAGAGVSAGMAGMGAQSDSDAAERNGVVGFLIDQGPVILLISVAAVVGALALRRRAAALVGLLAGGLLYWGMYGQDSLALMYASIVIGFTGWAVAAR